jgi:hypothetical protein
MATTGRAVQAGETWEHSYVQVHTSDLALLVRKLNDLAAEGWEVVSTHSADRTIGLNSVTAMIRRRIVPLVEPDDLDEGWCPDPSGRWQSRYWNGRAWTYHVAADDGKQDRDPPTMLTPAEGLTQ